MVAGYHEHGPYVMGDAGALLVEGHGLNMMSGEEPAQRHTNNVLGGQDQRFDTVEQEQAAVKANAQSVLRSSQDRVPAGMAASLHGPNLATDSQFARANQQQVLLSQQHDARRGNPYVRPPTLHFPAYAGLELTRRPAASTGAFKLLAVVCLDTSRP
eukprot:COSAG01_NODE_84_length_27672_cov_60.966344_15_plen_157_part_00